MEGRTHRGLRVLKFEQPVRQLSNADLDRIVGTRHRHGATPDLSSVANKGRCSFYIHVENIVTFMNSSPS